MDRRDRDAAERFVDSLLQATRPSEASTQIDQQALLDRLGALERLLRRLHCVFSTLCRQQDFNAAELSLLRARLATLESLLRERPPQSRMPPSLASRQGRLG